MALPKRMDIPQSVKDVHAASEVIDLHGDTFLWSRFLGYDIGKRHKNRFPRAPFAWHIDLPRMEDAGCDGQVFGVVVSPLGTPERRRRAALRMLDEIEQKLATYESRIGLARNAQQYRELRRQGKFAALIGIEGAHTLGGRIELVEKFKERGACYFSIAHLTDNEACYPNRNLKRRHDGLSEFGRQVVEEIDRNRMILDMAHINEPGFFEILKLRKNKTPVIASHTGVKGAHDHWRNLTDEMIRAIADTEGCIGIMLHSGFISPSLFADLEHVVAHYLHVKKLVGARFLALGSDFDGFIVNPKGIHGIEDLPLLTEALLRAGFTETEMQGILGGNFLRVLEAVCG